MARKLFQKDQPAKKTPSVTVPPSTAESTTSHTRFKFFKNLNQTKKARSLAESISSRTEQNLFNDFLNSLEISHFQSIGTDAGTITSDRNFRLDMQNVSVSMFSETMLWPYCVDDSQTRSSQAIILSQLTNSNQQGSQKAFQEIWKQNYRNRGVCSWATLWWLWRPRKNLGRFHTRCGHRNRFQHQSPQREENDPRGHRRAPYWTRTV